VQHSWPDFEIAQGRMPLLSLSLSVSMSYVLEAFDPLFDTPTAGSSSRANRLLWLSSHQPRVDRLFLATF